jgi:hypothetical protein
MARRAARPEGARRGTRLGGRAGCGNQGGLFTAVPIRGNNADAVTRSVGVRSASRSRNSLARRKPLPSGKLSSTVTTSGWLRHRSARAAAADSDSATISMSGCREINLIRFGQSGGCPPGSSPGHDGRFADADEAKLPVAGIPVPGIAKMTHRADAQLAVDDGCYPLVMCRQVYWYLCGVRPRMPPSVLRTTMARGGATEHQPGRQARRRRA